MSNFEKNSVDAMPEVPAAVIRRLPRYYRHLRMLQAAGQAFVSSATLAEHLNLTASQIRQDLHWFGNFGAKKTGYPVDRLVTLLRHILGMGEDYRCVLIGVGKLGGTLIQNFHFQDAGCTLCAAFDSNSEKSGQELNGTPIYPMEKLPDIVAQADPHFAILTVPAQIAQQVADQLFALGVRRFWNITNVELTPQSDDVLIQNLHMIDSLQMLTYDMHFHGDKA